MNKRKRSGEDAEHRRNGNAEPLDDGQDERQETGLFEHPNTTVSSDVTIIYGKSREHQFTGHTHILSKLSSWFSNAVARSPQVLGIKRIHLRDDDPAMVLAMLRSAYNPQINLPNKGGPSVENAIYIIELYRVVSKYDFRVLWVQCLKLFEDQVWLWLLKSHEEGTAMTDGFCEIVKNLYTLPKANLGHPMISSLMWLTRRKGPVQIFWNGGKVPQLLIDASQEVAEFGRDLFLSMTAEYRSHFDVGTGKRIFVDLAVLILAECPGCNNFVRWDKWASNDRPKRMQCLHCGRVVEDRTSG